MIKLEINNEVNGRSFGAKFPTQEEANSWIEKQKAKNSWGKPERYIRSSELPEELQSRVLSTRMIEPEEGEAYEESLVKCDYVIEEEDLSQNAEYQAQQVLLNRQREYAKIDSMFLEALAEKEAGRPEKMQEYLALRDKIKLDYPKE